MNPNSICITGLGATSAAGSNIQQTLKSFTNLQRHPRRATVVEVDLDKPVFEVEIPNSTAKDNEFPSRTARLAALAVDEALQEAGRPQDNRNLRIGVCLGTTVACQLNSLSFYEDYRRTSHPDLEAVHRFLHGNLAEFIATRYGLRGPRTTIVNACSSGTDAIGVGKSWIESDICDVVVAGGADELNRVPLAGFNSLGIMSDEPCRPFDARRSGLNLGEGAGIVILEREDCARQRGCDALLTVAGYGAACDAYHMTAPHPEGLGLKRAIRSALAQAGLKTTEISFANAHGTATPDNDKVEGQALAEVFGDKFLFCSTKGRTGHTLGAAGGLEAVFTALGLMNGWIPASVGFAEADPAIPIQPVQEKTRVPGIAAISTSLAFGGNNAALVLKHD